jgi:hypothetical protein
MSTNQKHKQMSSTKYIKKVGSLDINDKCLKFQSLLLTSRILVLRLCRTLINTKINNRTGCYR